MRVLAIILGIVVIAMGLLWAGQGAGLINWPASSFMVDQRQWVTYGLATSALGLVVLIFGTRMK